MKAPLGQLLRYGVVGILSNAVGYLAYLAITAAGVEHKLAMTAVYAFGVVQTFIFNKRWTFEHAGASERAFARYCLVYASSYAVNLAALYVFADRLGYPHQIVQGVMIVVIAMLIFVAQKFWVFRAPRRRTGDATP